MSDFLLGDGDQTTLTLTPGNDAAGNPGLPIDPGSVTVSLPETTFLTATVQPDGTILVVANGPVTTDDVLTINATSGGVAIPPTAFPFDVGAGPATSLSVTASAPVPKA